MVTFIMSIGSWVNARYFNFKFQVEHSASITVVRKCWQSDAVVPIFDIKWLFSLSQCCYQILQFDDISILFLYLNISMMCYIKC